MGINNLSTGHVVNSSLAGYDTTRIYKAMAKARRGENITIAVLGGSITQGYAASSENTRWANLMTDWWIKTFPKSKVTLINAGIGGTGSDFGAHRVQDDVFKYNPDFVIVEFSVNDHKGAFASETMEGLLRQILVAPSQPGLMVLCLKQSDGTTALLSHKPVAEYYGVPVISFAELIDAQVAKDGIGLPSIFIDGLHPIDIGMKYISQFITDELNRIYATLPADDKIKKANMTLPSPKYSDVFSHTFKYNNSNISFFQNSGWQLNKEGDWYSETPGSEIAFNLEGNTISIMYSRFKESKRGMAEAWVDNGEHKVFDSYFTENWGPAKVFGIVGENLSDGKHVLHIKILDAHSEGTTGHYFQVLNVLIAGHLTNVNIPTEK